MRDLLLFFPKLELAPPPSPDHVGPLPAKARKAPSSTLPGKKAGLLLAGLILGALFCSGAFSQEIASAARTREGNGTKIMAQDKIQYKPLREVLSELEVKYNVSFGFAKKHLQNKMVKARSLETDGPEELESLLESLLAPLSLTHEKLENRYYVIFPNGAEGQFKSLERKSMLHQQQHHILNYQGFFAMQEPILHKMTSVGGGLYLAVHAVSGRVTDESGQGLPGVSVVLRGSTMGVSTGPDGNYSLNLPDGNGTLVFSFIGYLTQEVAVNNRTEINVGLKVDTKRLSELVVVGYGTQARREVTGAISSIKASEIVQLPVARVDQALQGRAAGVMVTNSGSPGRNPQVLIRGIGTVNDTNPLFVIDGLPSGSLNALNPNDIESVEVLKDAAAAAIYGSRGANGVVLITTKKGVAGATRVAVDSYYGVQDAWRQMDLLNREQYLAFGRDLLQNANQPVPQRFSDLGEFANVDTDWQGEMFRTAPIQSHNVNLSGGSDKYNFNVGAGYFKQDGIMLGTDFERVSVRSNSSFKMGRVTVGQTLTIAYSDRMNETQSGGRTQIEHILKSVPYIPVRDPSRLGGFRAPDRVDGSDPENPVLVATLRTNRTQTMNILGTGFAEVNILNGLQYKFLVGMDMAYGTRDQFTPKFSAGDFSFTPFASMSLGRSTFISPLISNQLTFSRQFGIHSINAVGVLERQTFRSDNLNGAGRNTLTNDIRVLNGTSDQTAGGNLTEYALISYVGRVNYTLAEKYLFGASIRRDGGSRFGPNNKWGVFPSVSAGWRISGEQFMAGLPAISDLKLRASFGTTGNDRIGDYQYIPTVVTNYPTNFGNNIVPGATVRALADPNIKWESTVMKNIGLDLGLFNDRFVTSLEYFDNETRDMIIGRPIPPSLGYPGAPTANIGTVSNRGFELTTGYRKSAGTFQWSLDANFSAIRNRLVSLANGRSIAGPNFAGDPVTFTEEGQPIAYFFGWVMDGIFQQGDNFSQQPTAKPGDIRFRDIAGPRDENNNPTGPDGVIDANDRTNIGHFMPDFTYGLNASASFKGFDFTMFLQGVQGNEIMNTNLYHLQGMTRLFNSSTDVLRRWTPTNTDTDVPRAINGDPSRNARLSTRYIEDGSYLRIKNLSIGYSLPQSLLNSLGNGVISNIRVYLSSQNLLTLTKYTGYDPEIGASEFHSQSYARGVDYGQFPQARTFIGGIQIGL